MKRSDEECKKIIKDVARHCDVKPELILERLIDESDKNDLRDYKLDKKTLIKFVILWRDEGFENYNLTPST